MVGAAQFARDGARRFTAAQRQSTTRRHAAGDQARLVSLALIPAPFLGEAAHQRLIVETVYRSGATRHVGWEIEHRPLGGRRRKRRPVGRVTLSLTGRWPARVKPHSPKLGT